MTQLALLDEYLQAEMAQAPHWREPRSKIRTSFRQVKADYGAWLEHTAGCEPCTEARDDLVALRDGSLEWEPRPPCPVGIRLLPLGDVDAAAFAIAREEGRRRGEPAPGCTHRSCANCMPYACHWRDRVVRRLERVQLSLTWEGAA